MTNKYLGPRMGFDLRELELCVIWVHLLDLLSGGGAQHLDNLHQLVHPTISRKYWLAEH